MAMPTGLDMAIGTILPVAADANGATVEIVFNMESPSTMLISEWHSGTLEWLFCGCGGRCCWIYSCSCCWGGRGRWLRELLTHLLLMARRVTLLVLQQLFQQLSLSG